MAWHRIVSCRIAHIIGNETRRNQRRFVETLDTMIPLMQIIFLFMNRFRSTFRHLAINHVRMRYRVHQHFAHANGTPR